MPKPKPVTMAAVKRKKKLRMSWFGCDGGSFPLDAHTVSGFKASLDDASQPSL